MATVYLQPGTGTGTGTASDPYFYSQLSTAETAAGSGGTILFLDGDYNFSTSVTWGADGVTYKSLNRLGAKILTTANNLIFGIGSSLITAPTIADGFYVENFLLKLTSPDQTVDTNKVAKFNNLKLVQNLRHTGVNCIYAGADAASFHEVNGCELNCKPAASGCRPFQGCSGGTMTRSSVYIDFDANVTFNDRGTAKFDTFTNCIIASNGNGTFTQNYSSNSTNCMFYQMGTTNNSGGTNNISQQDPLFVDAGNDLRLRPASPAIGAAS
jgi:hypothetical protein